MSPEYSYWYRFMGTLTALDEDTEEAGEGYEVAASGDVRPWATYWRMMLNWLEPLAVTSSSLSPEKRVNCFCVSSTILRAFRSR